MGELGIAQGYWEQLDKIRHSLIPLGGGPIETHTHYHNVESMAREH